MTPNIPSVKSVVHEKIAQLEEQPTLYPMELWNLNSVEYQLKMCPIQIVVEVWPDNEYIAHWHDVEAVGFGEAKEEAIFDLCQCIIDLHERLSNTTDEKLGKIPLRAKKILQKMIEKAN